MTSSTSLFIEFAIEKKVLQFGDFITKAGRNSPYFFNLGKFNDGKSLKLLGEFYANKIIDTIKLARIKFPGASASLDALCRRFNIDNSKRNYHGALLDANLLSEVYIELIGGRQQDLVLNKDNKLMELNHTIQKTVKRSRSFKPSVAEEATHRKFIETLDDPLWLILENEDKIEK